MMDLSGSRWICVATLAVVMLSSASQVDSQFVLPPCCKPKPMEEPQGNVQCNVQRAGKTCQHAYLIRVNGSRPKCVTPTEEWIKLRLESGELNCPRFTSRDQMFFLDVVEEDDLDE